MSTVDIHAATLVAVAGIDAAKTPDEAGQEFCRYTGQFGLTHVLCCILPEIGAVAGNEYVFYSNPDGFAKRTLADPGVFEDVAFHELQRTSRPVPWADEALRKDTLHRILRTEGLTDGVIFPLFGGNGLLGTMLLGGEAPWHGDDSLTFLRLLSVFFYDRLCSMRRGVLREQYGLSAREFECMKWVAAGKTDWETGQILSISPKTVNYHVENAKRKFGVSTRLQGVVAAIMSGAVEP